jgi:hypothetical protein
VRSLLRARNFAPEVLHADVSEACPQEGQAGEEGFAGEAGRTYYLTRLAKNSDVHDLRTSGKVGHRTRLLTEISRGINPPLKTKPGAFELPGSSMLIYGYR